MDEDFKPGTRVRVAADATCGREGMNTELYARDADLGVGPWEGVVQDGPDEDGDYWIGIRGKFGLYAHRDYVTEADPLPVGTRVQIDADATYGSGSDRTSDSLPNRAGPGPWLGLITRGPDSDGDYQVSVAGSALAVYAHSAYVTALDEEPEEDTKPAPAEYPLSPWDTLTDLLRSITDAGYHATEVEVAPAGTITIRVDRA